MHSRCDDVPTALLTLPESLRSELKSPFGTVFTDPETLLSAVEGPLISVGDIVTYHIVEAGQVPDLVLYDDRTARGPVSEEVRSTFDGPDVIVENPAGTLTETLLTAIRDGIDQPSKFTIRIEGEEDLAALPAIIAAPDGASVVYGQPEEGMVHVRVTPEVRDRISDLIVRMVGNSERALAILRA